MGTKGTWRRPAAVSRREEAERWARISPPCPMCPNPDLEPGVVRQWKPCFRHADGPEVAEPDEKRYL